MKNSELKRIKTQVFIKFKNKEDTFNEELRIEKNQDTRILLSSRIISSFDLNLEIFTLFKPSRQLNVICLHYENVVT